VRLDREYGKDLLSNGPDIHGPATFQGRGSSNALGDDYSP